MEELAQTRLLHNFRPRKTGELTETIITKDDGICLDLSIGNHKIPICKKLKILKIKVLKVRIVQTVIMLMFQTMI